MASQQACLRWILLKILILCGKELTEKNWCFCQLCPHFFAKPPNYEMCSVDELSTW